MNDVNEGMTLDQFLGHKSREGGGGKFLSRWKQNNPPQVDVWLHTRATILSLWQHPWPRIVPREDPQTKIATKEVWSGQFNSWETEDILKKQYIRDKKTDERRYPPQICPMSLLLEEVRRLVRERRLSWTAPLFRFVGDDPAKGKVLHAAGIYNGFRDDDLTRDEKEELRRCGIFIGEAWKENMMAKCNYVFRVVDNDNPGNGVQIATETTLLGECVQREIEKVMKSLGSEAGHPLRNPYCIRWEHHPSETPQNKYSATRMERIPLTREIEDLIRGTDPPSVDRMAERGNIATLRASMEHHYCGPERMIDWDRIFGPAEALQAQQGGTDEAPALEQLDRPPAQQPAQQPARQEEQVLCDDCRKPMGITQMTCPHCGRKYVDPEPWPDPEQPPMRSRSEAGADPAPVNGQGWPEPGGPGDPIPF